MSVADNNDAKMDTVGLFLRAMVDREPGKRKVKASKAALIDLAQLEMGDSSDDSDFNVDEAKLNEDDDISINSDPDAEDGGSSSSSGDGEEDDEDSDAGSTGPLRRDDHTLSVTELLERARQKQQLVSQKDSGRPQILVCAVCLGDNSDDTNEIVTCDGWCHVSVHEGCYGVSDTVSVSSTVSSCSTEPWFCDACKAGVRNPPCELCPNLGYSIFKETEMGRWVHLVCALYVPGVAFSEVDKLSFPTLFEMAYSRWGSKVCSLCEDARYAKTGVCIGCDAGMCRSYFHVTCAQREGLLSEVNHGEADQADPYYAHCKLHTDRELIKRRKRNWLTLQLHTKQADQMTVTPKEQSRLERKLAKYRDKYVQVKASRPTPWYPTQKMPRSISTCASVFRTLLHKTQLMGLSTETAEAEITAVGDIRKKWHIPPAFSVEFTSYYTDRIQRIKEMKQKLETLLDENSALTQEESKLKDRLDEAERKSKAVAEENATLLSKSLELHNLLKGLAGRPLPLPPVVAAIHNPPSTAPPPMPPQSKPGAAGGRETRRIITKAAAKMLADPPPDSTLGSSRSLHSDPFRLGDSSHQPVTPSKITPTSSSSSSSIPSTTPTTITAATSSKSKEPALSATHSPVKAKSSTAAVSAAYDVAVAPTSGSIPNSSNSTNSAISASPVNKSKHLAQQHSQDQQLTKCSVCRQTTNQNLQIQCDTCTLYYHLCCLDPPLTRMPKKTKQMGWQCSDCCKSSDSEKVAEVDTSAPRRLRRVIKEPAKFSPSLASSTSACDQAIHERSPPSAHSGSATTAGLASPTSSKGSEGATTTASKSGGAAPVSKRRRSSDVAKKGGPGSALKKARKGAPDSERGGEDEGSKAGEFEKESCDSAQGEPDSAGESSEIRSEKGKSLDKSDNSKQKGINDATSPIKTINATKYLKGANDALGKGRNTRSVPADQTTPDLSKDDTGNETSIIGVEQKDENKFNSALEGRNASPSDLIHKPVTTFSTTVTPVSARGVESSSVSDNKPSVTPSSSSTIVADLTSIAASSFSSSSPAYLPCSIPSIATALTSTAAPTCSTNIGPLGAGVGHAIPVSFSTNPLDMSADSLPSAASLHSPTSESLHSHEEDNQPHSPRKEKRHRDGSKKKKKDKDRDKDKTGEKGEKKRKKHHHSYWDAQPHQSSEMLAPLRLKIKPLPPRPPESVDAFLPSTQGSLSMTCLSQPDAATLPRPATSHILGQKLIASPSLQHLPAQITFPVTPLEYPARVGQSNSIGVTNDVTLPPTASLSTTPISHPNPGVTVTPVAGPPGSGGAISDGGGSSSSSDGGTTGPASVPPPPGYPPLPPGYTLTQPLLADSGTLLSTHPSSVEKGASYTIVSSASNTNSTGTGIGSRRSSGSGSSCSVAGVTATTGGRRKSDSSAAAAAAASGQQFSKCDVCGETGGITNTVACDECHKACHFNCLDPPLKKSPKRRGYSWFCEDCEPSK